MSLYISHSKPKLAAPLALPRLSEYLTPGACREKLGKLRRDQHKLVMKHTKKQFALEDFGPKRTELEAEALALAEEVAYLEALLPRLPAGKTRSKREYRHAQAAYAHNRCLRKLEKFSGPRHVDLQAEVQVLAAKVENLEVAITMLEDHLTHLIHLEAQEAQESQQALALEAGQSAAVIALAPAQAEEVYAQAAKALLLMVWCWQQARHAAQEAAQFRAMRAFAFQQPGFMPKAFQGTPSLSGLTTPSPLPSLHSPSHSSSRPPTGLPPTIAFISAKHLQAAIIFCLGFAESHRFLWLH